MHTDYLIFFQNCQWIHVLLQMTWIGEMMIMIQHCPELYDQDGVILYYLFLQHFAVTTSEKSY
jgi:hypothetical protein